VEEKHIIRKDIIILELMRIIKTLVRAFMLGLQKIKVLVEFVRGELVWFGWEKNWSGLGA
jgi:hypothetical protein